MAIKEDVSPQAFHKLVVDQATFNDRTWIAIDSNGYPHVAYVMLSSSGGSDVYYVKYAKWTGTNWFVENPYITAIGEINKDFPTISFALDTSNNPHICYTQMISSSEEDVMYASWNGNSWDIQTVDNNKSKKGRMSLAIDDLNIPHISYDDVGSLVVKYAVWNGNGWDKEIVEDTGSFLYSSLCIDKKRFPHICYSDFSASPTYFLKYANWTGNGWDYSEIDTPDPVTGSMALGGNGNPQVFYSWYHTNEVKYAKRIGTQWNTERIDIGAWPLGETIAVDSNNNPHVIYNLIRGDAYLTYAYNTGSGWKNESIEDLGGGASIAIDKNDKIHIFYGCIVANEMRYATNSSIGTPEFIVVIIIPIVLIILFILVKKYKK